mmetsp:Transcript_3592/g.11034  ORF Transcript_3592/g.11034 Transcript_3592/m.11034 type:complete len:82 (-) Transcript_3592:766-1011(-)
MTTKKRKTAKKCQEEASRRRNDSSKKRAPRSSWDNPLLLHFLIDRRFLRSLSSRHSADRTTTHNSHTQHIVCSRLFTPPNK